MIAEVDRLEQAGAQLALPMGEAEARECVAEIKRGVQSMLDRLTELQTRAGWRSLGYETWDACLKGEFGYSRTYLSRMLDAAETARAIGVPNWREGTLRPLVGVEPTLAREVWEEVTAAGKPTAARINEALASRREAASPALAAPDTEPFAPLGDPGTSATAFNTDLPTDDDPAPLCHECGEPVPGALEGGLPVICEKCAPAYYAEGEPAPVDRRAMPQSDPPEVTVSTPGQPFRHTLEYRGLEAAPGAVTETVGTPQSPGIPPRAPREAQHASTVPVGSQDHPGASEAVSRQATEFDEEDRLLGEIDYAEIRRNGDDVGVVMAVYREVIARAQEGTRAAMAFRATLQRARGGRGE
jgi:hypothetical protein